MLHTRTASLIFSSPQRKAEAIVPLAEIYAVVRYGCRFNKKKPASGWFKKTSRRLGPLGSRCSCYSPSSTRGGYTYLDLCTPRWVCCTSLYLCTPRCVHQFLPVYAPGGYTYLCTHPVGTPTCAPPPCNRKDSRRHLLTCKSKAIPHVTCGAPLGSLERTARYSIPSHPLLNIQTSSHVEVLPRGSRFRYTPRCSPQELAHQQ
jgi:hypothetical protein